MVYLFVKTFQLHGGLWWICWMILGLFALLFCRNTANLETGSQKEEKFWWWERYLKLWWISFWVSTFFFSAEIKNFMFYVLDSLGEFRCKWTLYLYSLCEFSFVLCDDFRCKWTLFLDSLGEFICKWTLCLDSLGKLGWLFISSNESEFSYGEWICIFLKFHLVNLKFHLVNLKFHMVNLKFHMVKWSFIWWIWNFI